MNKLGTMNGDRLGTRSELDADVIEQEWAELDAVEGVAKSSAESRAADLPSESTRRGRTATPSTPADGSAYRGKRLVDFLFASLLLLSILPLLLLLAAAVRLTSTGPVLFGHTRIGRDGKPFRCLKFRTMCTDAEERLEDLLESDPIAREEYAATFKLKDDPRVTRIGNTLRCSSLDELPQLLNVVRGQMSLVGPRPIVKDELPLYGEHKAAYLGVRPGVTGAWQVSGRSDLSYEERVDLDVHYVGTQSLGRDAAILCRTSLVVIKRVGAY